MAKQKTARQNQMNLRNGLVLRSTGSHYRVKSDDGSISECVIRGKFRLKGLRTTNPIAVGDRVRYLEDETGNVIVALEPRENYILRKATNLSAAQQILCANIDQTLIVVTIKQPDMSLGFVDRFLVMSGAFHIPAVLIFNKIDLLNDDDDFFYLEAYTELYRSIGYEVVHVSAKDAQYAQTIKNVLQDKTSFLYGRSGVGKSSLINLVAPALTLRTGEVSDRSGRGKHTTTFAEMFELDFGGYIIDAPGLREFEPTDIEKIEIAHYMPDFLKHIDKCKYNNCIHFNEPGCGVKQALENGDIAESRYYNYLNMLFNTELEKHPK